MHYLQLERPIDVSEVALIVEGDLKQFHIGGVTGRGDETGTRRHAGVINAALFSVDLFEHFTFEIPHDQHGVIAGSQDELAWNKFKQ